MITLKSTGIVRKVDEMCIRDSLNTLCNYDPDIIPLLDSEPGTAWCRDQSGVFRPELYQPDEE